MDGDDRRATGTEPTKAQTAETAGENPPRILVLDDEDFLRMLFGKIISHIGYSVIATKEGSETLTEFERAREAGEPYAAVILDLSVPQGLGGLDIVAKLRLADPKIPILATSGNPQDPAMENPSDYGFSGVLNKPFRRDDLAALLKAHIPL